MKLAIVTTYPNVYQLKRLNEAAINKGYDADVLNIKNLIVEVNIPINYDKNIALTSDDLKKYDLVIFRSVSKYRDIVIPLVKTLRDNGVKVFFNNVEKYHGFVTKMSDAIKFKENQIPHPKTLQCFNEANFLDCCRILNFPVIVKEIKSSKGNGVYKLDNEEEAQNFIKIHKKKLNKLLLQEYISYDQDLRIFIAGNKILGVMQRIPKNGEFRANFSQGGDVKLVEIDEKIKNLALEVEKISDSYICGIDIIIKNNQPYVLEINRAPGFEGLEKATGKDIANIVLEESISKAI